MFLSYAQNGEDAMLWRALRTVREGFYIDVGAFDPDEDSVTRAFYERGWRGVNVEPVVEAWRRLTLRRPFDVNLNLALGAAPGEARLFRVGDTGLSTLDPAQAESYRAEGRLVEARATPVATLAQVCREHAAGPIHFLKIDCECAERAVLEGADFAAFRPWIVLVEATAPNSQTPTHARWEPLLLSAGYRFVWFDGLNRFYLAEEKVAALASFFETPLNCFDDVRQAPRPEPRPAPPQADPFEAAAPACLDNERRTAMTARCRDADPVPKVEGAGEVRAQGDGERVQIMHNGLRVAADAYCGPWMTRLITLCRGHHEPQEERIFHEVVSRLPPAGAMIELGGWWSYYSAWFLLDRPQRRAVILEPDPVHRAAGEKTMALNGLQAEFVDGYAAAAPRPAGPFATEDSGEVTARGLGVAQLMDQRGLQRIDILHCDIQGAELDVLEGCRPLFAAGRIGWVFVSTHAFQISGDPLTHQRCLALLREAGGVIEAEHDVHESFSGDGLIVARFGPAPAGWRPVSLSLNRYGESLFRNPAYDLARERRRGPSRAALEATVEALYQALLGRRADPGGLASNADLVERTGDYEALVGRLMRSAEFQKNWSGFSRRWFNRREVAAARFLAEDGALLCTGLDFVLQRDGPLGRRGQRLRAPLDEVMLPAVFAQGAWNAADVTFLAERIAPGQSVGLIDIGANIGLFTRQMLLACDRIAGAWCVEPDPENFAALAANLADFGADRVRLYNLALGAEDGAADFFRDAGNFGNRSLNPDAMRGRPFEAAKVRVAAAGAWMEANLPADGPLVWKSDTQGHDELIVGQAPWSVWERVQAAMIELWRIDKTGLDRGDFLDKVEHFPHRRLGADVGATTRDVEAWLDSTDARHADLFLWR